MPFFKENRLPPTNRVNVIPDDICRAGKLQTVLERKRKLQAKPNPRLWADEFAKLRHELGPARITPVLAWYCQNIGNEYVPVAYSAASFRKKFIAIEAAMRRAAPPIAKTIGRAAAQIVDGMRLYWPECRDYGMSPTTREDVLTVAHRTFEGYSLFLKILEFHITKVATTRDAKRLAYLLQSLPRPNEFTRLWLIDIHRYAWGHGAQRWNGRIGAFAWRPNHPRHVRLCRELLASYCGNAADKTWAAFVRKAYEHEA